MRKAIAFIAVLALAAPALTGCVYHGTQTNLTEAATKAGMMNITTGDGTFENYKATGYYTGQEFGLAVGIPGLWKITELFPVQSNEDLLARVADEAKAGGANAMINVTPHSEHYYGFPFGILGFYVDTAAGTGIKVGK